MYVMNHGENDKDVFDGGLTGPGKDKVVEVITKIKKSQNPKNARENYISDIVTGTSRCCIETAQIAAEILNVGIKKTPFYENVPQYCSEESFRIKIFVSMLANGQQVTESKKEFYERVRILLNNADVRKIGDLYYSIDKEGTPSPLLLPDDNYWRKQLLITDRSMINALYGYYCSYNPEMKALAEQQSFARDYASIFKVDQEFVTHYDGKKTLYMHTGTIRECNHRDF